MKTKILLFFAIMLIIPPILNSCKKEKIPSLSTNSIINITLNSANCGGIIIDDGDSKITERGICLSTSQVPYITDSLVLDNTNSDSFIIKLLHLKPNQTYLIKAYAINKIGVGYGEQISFSTSVVSYSNDLQQIFTANCITCHNGSQLPNLTAGLSYISLLNTANLIDTINPSNSRLYQNINFGGSMASYAPIGFADEVLSWIQEGAKNN